MGQDNLSAPLTLSTVSLPGTLSATLSGFFLGSQKAAARASEAMKELDSAKQESLLQALAILDKGINEIQDKDLAGLDNFPKGLKEMLPSTARGAAYIAGKFSLIPSSIASHFSELPVDVKIVLEGILNSVEDYKQFSQTKMASTFNVENKYQAFAAHCNALCNQLSDISKKLKENIDDNFKIDGVKKGAAKSHAKLAKKTASATTAPSLTVALTIAGMADTIGTVLREVSALVNFSNQETFHPAEKNIYNAFTNCCEAFSEGKRSIESFDALLKLREAIKNFDVPKEMLDNQSVSAPALSVFTRLLIAEPFVQTLIALEGSVLGLKEATDVLKLKDEEFTQNFNQSATQASLIKGVSNREAQTHSHNVTAFCALFDEALLEIDKKLDFDMAIVAGAKSTIISNSALVIAPSLIMGLTGMISRELSASIDFTQNDKGSKEESLLVMQSRQEMTGADLDALLSRIYALEERVMRSNELGVSAPVILGIGEAATSGSLIASLNVLAGMCSALKEFQTLSQSPSNPLILDEEKKAKAVQYAESVREGNKNTANTLGSNEASNNLSFDNYLDSVMEKVVLTHRSRQDFIHHGNKRNDINSTGKASIAFCEGNSTGFIAGAAGILVLTALQSGIGAETLALVLRESTAAKRLSDGLDKIQFANGSKINLSSASNATRLLEGALEKHSLIQSSVGITANLFEGTFSRTLLVALCQSGVLKDVLTRLIKEEEEKLNNAENEQLNHAPGYLDSAVISDALWPQLENNTFRALHEAPENQNPIPNLAADMAASLASVGKMVIASTLVTHSALISPVLKSIVATKRASNIPADFKNEALIDSELSRITSTALNNLQAFTKNFKFEINAINDPIKNSALLNDSDDLQRTLMVLGSATTLFVEELFEICISRSLTLLDKDKVAKSFQESREEAQKEAEFSSDGMANDSGNDLSHAILAIRLTLSHLGVALAHFASGMNIDTDQDLLQDKLNLHVSQQKLMKSMLSIFSQCSAGMLSLAGILSALPLSSVGSIDSLREFIHSLDQDLIIRPVNSGEDLTHELKSQSTLLTGIGSDCLSSILSAVTKLLLQSSIIGLDSSLAIAKILEILCIHPRPDAALLLETQGFSQPNGVTANLNEQIQCLLVQGSIGSASVCAVTQTGKSSWTQYALNSIQKEVDKHIDDIALLADDEEAEQLGLREFYELLIRVMTNDKGKNEDYENLIERLDRGGITLSSYHSAHGGILNEKRRDSSSNKLIKNDSILGCDNAGALLLTFINKAYQEERLSHGDKKLLLDKLKDTLIGKPLSAKSKERWNYIVNNVADRLQLSSARSSLFNSSMASWEARKINLLTNWEYLSLEEGQSSSASEPEYEPAQASLLS